MRRKSTPVLSDREGSESLPLKNTGLRPSWDAFWGVDLEISMARRDTLTTSTTSTKSEGGGRVMKFVSGSEWVGEWDKLGMCGAGLYRMPHGVIYDGTMNGGVFEGIGVLRYPNGGALEGFWHQGKLKYCQYDYADGLKRDTPTDWPYCTMPDRRFYSELLHGLRPADTEQLTGVDPPRTIPPGQYDVGDGFYSPHTKCVTDPCSGEVLRIPLAVEEKWTLENCRAADIGTVGYRPDLYENWFKVNPEDPMEREYSEAERQILSLILQEGGELDVSTPRASQDRGTRGTSLQSKLDPLSLRELHGVSSVWSRSGADLETIWMKLVKEVVKENKKSHSIKKTTEEPDSWSDIGDEDFEDIEDNGFMKMIHEIVSLPERIEQQSMHGSGQSAKESSVMKKSTGLILEKTTGLRILSSTTPKSASATSSGNTSIFMGGSKSVPKNPRLTDNEDLETTMSEFMGSDGHYNIDYTDFE